MAKASALGTILPGRVSPAIASQADLDVVTATLWDPTQNCVLLEADIPFDFHGSIEDFVLVGLATGYSAAEIEEALEAGGPDYRDEQPVQERAERHRLIRWGDIIPSGQYCYDTGVEDTRHASGYLRLRNLRLRLNEDDTLTVWCYNFGGAALAASALLNLYPKLLVRWEA